MGLGQRFRGFFNPFIVLGAIGVGLLLLGVMYILLKQNRSPQSPVGAVTAVLTIIPASTNTSEVPEIGSTEEITPTATVLPTPLPGSIVLGAYVQITGTGGDGLRLRSGPGLDHQALFLGVDAEVYQVEGGPEDADGYTWWQLVAPLDTSRSGWAVSDYLEVVQNP
jgi:hypothetical protein